MACESAKKYELAKGNKNYAGSENHSPHWNKEMKATLVPEYRETSLPADSKGPVREDQQSTRRRKEVTKRLGYQPQTSKSTKHRNCRQLRPCQRRVERRRVRPTVAPFGCPLRVSVCDKFMASNTSWPHTSVCV